jgi:hypothetical protein
VRPQGLVDSIGVVLDRSDTTAAGFVVFRHQHDGLADEEARRRMRLLTPHIRRAVLIGNVINLCTPKLQALLTRLTAYPPASSSSTQPAAYITFYCSITADTACAGTTIFLAMHWGAMTGSPLISFSSIKHAASQIEASDIGPRPNTRSRAPKTAFQFTSSRPLRIV